MLEKIIEIFRNASSNANVKHTSLQHINALIVFNERKMRGKLLNKLLIYIQNIEYNIDFWLKIIT